METNGYNDVCGNRKIKKKAFKRIKEHLGSQV